MSKKRLNLHEQGYKAGDPMWVSWDKRWDGPMRRELMWEGVYQEERLVTTIGFFRYDDREFLALDRTKRPNGCEDIIYIPTPLVKEYGKFHAEQYSTFIRYIFVYNTLVSERLNVRIRRYAEATNYAKVLTGVYNGIPKGENGMIIKYQNPPHGIARRDATYVAPKMYAPRPYKTKEEEIIEQNRNSEMISIPAHSTIGMVDGKLQVIDTPARQITNVGAGYLSGTDPVGEFVVGNVAAGKPLMWLGKGVKYGAARVFKKGAKPKVDAYYPSKVYKRTVDDVNRDYLNFIEYIDNPETMQKLADIDKELGTQYVKAVTDFKEAAKQGKLRVKSPKPGTLDIQGYPIRNPQTLTHPDIMKNPSYDYIDIDILADFPPNSVGHEFKHAIENYQAALSGIKGSVDDALFANPRLQALMKDNIVSEDEFVASMVKRYPKNDIKEIRKVYKYLTDPGEFNAQLHPLIELEQRAGKSGLPNFKDADAVNQVIKQGRASGHGGSHLDILFNNLLKPDKREEFVKQFNKYGWSLAAPAIINNRE